MAYISEDLCGHGWVLLSSTSYLLDISCMLNLSLFIGKLNPSIILEGGPCFLHLDQ